MPILDLAGELRKLQWFVGRWLPEREITCDTKNGRLTFSSRDGVIARRLFSRRHWSWDLLEQSLRLLVDRGLLDPQENGTLINVGANIGSLLTPLMSLGGFRHGYAFEPAPQNYQYLCRNVRQNRLGDSVQVFPWALSARDQLGQLELSPRNCGDHRVRGVQGSPPGKDLSAEAKRQTVQIALRSLDALVQSQTVQVSRRSLIWVDIQGHEGQFFLGARQTIGQGVVVVSEIWPYGIRRAGMTAREFTDIVTALFKGFYRFQRRRWQWHEGHSISAIFDELAHRRGGTDVILVPHSAGHREPAAVGDI